MVRTAIFETIYKVLRSKVFSMNEKDALHIMEQCFCGDNEGVQESYKTHQIALDSYVNYLADIEYVSPESKKGGKMKETTIAKYLDENTKRFQEFKRSKNAA